MLITEVADLRAQSSQMQFELAHMLRLKSKYASGGLFDPDWKPLSGDIESPTANAPPPPKEPTSVKPAWRTVTRESLRKQRSDTLLVRQSSPARSAIWASGRTDLTDLTIALPSSPPAYLSDSFQRASPGFYPPPTPRRTASGPVSRPPVATSWANWQSDHPFMSTPSPIKPPLQAEPRPPVVTSWATWQPDPNFASTPPSTSVETAPLSGLERETPVRFGPRSPWW